MALHEDQWPAADAKWLAYFAEETIHLIDGAREALDLLDRHNIVRGIVTSGSRERILRELRHHDVASHFVHVICGTDVREKKPHPAALQLCLERMGVGPAETAYVGDSPEDVQMARAAGVAAVAIRGSYPNVEALLASTPDYLADSLSDAVNHLLS
jgi:phosphoglycolate phosphatase